MKKTKLFTLISASALVLMACGSEESTKESSNESSSPSVESSEQVASSESSVSEESSSSADVTQEVPRHGLNEAVVMFLDDPSETVAEVKVTKVTDNVDAFPDYLKSGDYFDIDKLILIQVEYTNIAYPENLAFGLNDFQAFSENGKQLPNISQQNGGDPVAQSRTATAEFYIESEEPQDKIELDFLPEGNTTPVATFEVEVEH